MLNNLLTVLSYVFSKGAQAAPFKGGGNTDIVRNGGIRNAFVYIDLKKEVLWFFTLSILFHLVTIGIIFTVSLKEEKKHPNFFARIITPEEFSEYRSQKSEVSTQKLQGIDRRSEVRSERSGGRSLAKSENRKLDQPAETKSSSSDPKSSTPVLPSFSPEKLIQIPGRPIVPESSVSDHPISRLFDNDIIAQSIPEKRVKTEPPQITFDTREFKYKGYMARLKEKIESIWQYPRSAAERGIYGDLFIRFSIKRDGSLGRVDLVRTSGYRDLDEAALMALRNAAPFWPLPKEWDIEEFIIEGHFIYTLYGYYIR